MSNTLEPVTQDEQPTRQDLRCKDKHHKATNVDRPQAQNGSSRRVKAGRSSK